MVKAFTRDPEVQRIVEKYGEGFDSIYFDGKADGYTEGFNKGIEDAKLEAARTLLANGFDEEFVSLITEISIDKIKNLKREFN